MGFCACVYSRVSFYHPTCQGQGRHAKAPVNARIAPYRTFAALRPTVAFPQTFALTGFREVQKLHLAGLTRDEKSLVYIYYALTTNHLRRFREYGTGGAKGKFGRLGRNLLPPVQ